MANPISLTLLTSLLFSAIPVEGLVLPGGVGRLPALGWNSWNAFGCDINASKVLTAARQVVGLGLKDLGYEYINIDDCWSLKDRDPVTQRLVPDSEKFPDGIAGVAKEIHELGLKVGIYSSAGTQTCAGYPASLGYETIDAQTFAEWGIDYLKYDNCGVPSNWTDTYTHCVPDETNGQHFLNGTCPDLESPAPEGYDWRQSNTAKRYRLMRDALMNVNRTIVYSLCVWGQANVGVWGNETGNSWRVSGDITDSYTRIASLLNQHSFYLNAANFWGYPDADMLEVGNGKLTMGENRVHFALWAVMKSPLIIGTELDQISPSHLTILKNKYLLAFNQDPLIGRPAVPFKWGYNPDWTFDAQHPAEYWAGESSSLRGTLVLMLNTENQTALRGFEFREVPGLRHKLHSGVEFKVDLDLGLDGDGRDEKKEGFEVVDIWSGENLGCVKGGISREVESHDVVGVVVLGRC